MDFYEFFGFKFFWTVIDNFLTFIDFCGHVIIFCGLFMDYCDFFLGFVDFCEHFIIFSGPFMDFYRIVMDFRGFYICIAYKCNASKFSGQHFSR